MPSNKKYKALIVGDLHYQAHDRNALLCASALDFWKILQSFARKSRPDAIFVLGDLIDGYHLSQEVCRRDLIRVQSEFQKSPTPVHPIIGNHETIYLPDRPFIKSILGLDVISRAVNLGPLRVICLDLTVDHQSHGFLTKEKAEWLKEIVLTEPNRPCVILQHPLIHPEEEICEHRHYIYNSFYYNDLIYKLQNILAIFTGHRHIPGLANLEKRFPTPKRPASDASAAAARQAPLRQITLGCFCAWPLTFGELTVEPAARRVIFRERALAGLPAEHLPPDFDALVERARRLRAASQPEHFAGRVMLTPELSEVVCSW